jgi:hypothetical protein
MTDTNTRGLRAGRYQGLAVVAIGISHFLVPRAFDPINRLGFPEHPRKFTYINGAIETMIGVLMAVPRSRRQRLRPNVGVNDDRLGSLVGMLGDGSDSFVAGDLGVGLGSADRGWRVEQLVA